ncbi:general receptor for phosphoinositides 1-associated scaffold protein [Pseudochaenichthys georgianus]|uniref:general receptor for phosphoinositides 1-associated scaffold protein n=1 Tax=Pseudochaenichthys georgianus TaxID=52239 RepID=UPI00146DA6FE|nr:general receptor for phosphoinositides 1-associated scaffold protein [Pseudochaenichthys georgianus]
MTFRRLKKVNSSGHGSQESDIYFLSSKSDSCRTQETNCSEVYNYKSLSKSLAYSGGTLPRSFKKGGGLQKWKPLTLAPEPQRKVVVLEKKEEEAFGFEIQTYGLHHEDQNSVEMCTFVCKVHEDGPAQEAGLKVGDTISSVNEETVEGFRHKEIVQLIRACGNTLRLETVYSDSIRKAEMEARLQYLKQTLHEKWDEYRSLMVQEQRLVHGIVLSDAGVYESLESAGVYGSVGTPSPAEHRSLHCSSGSTSSVQSTNTTEEEPLYSRLQRPDAAAPPTDRKPRVRPVSELFSGTKTNLTRSASTRSYLRGGGNTAGEKQGGFTQRKPKQKSFRRTLLKFIPGLNRPLEEEESKL